MLVFSFSGPGPTQGWSRPQQLENNVTSNKNHFHQSEHCLQHKHPWSSQKPRSAPSICSRLIFFLREPIESIQRGKESIWESLILQVFYPPKKRVWAATFMIERLQLWVAEFDTRIQHIPLYNFQRIHLLSRKWATISYKQSRILFLLLV